MKKAKKILQPFVERPFSHTTIVSDDNALKAMWHYAVAFGAWYSGMEPEKVKADLERFENEQAPAEPVHTKYVPGCECDYCRNIFRSS